MSGTGLNGKTGEVLRWAFGLVLAAIVAYFTSMGAVQVRIAVVETRVDALKGDVSEIKSDVKTLLRNLR